MKQLFSRMRELSIRDLKDRREEIFERTRSIVSGRHQEEHEHAESATESAVEEGERMEEELEGEGGRGADRRRELNNRVRRYWRKLLQVSEWMVEVPDNLPEFYVTARPAGNKCLAVFREGRMELRDKAGGLLERRSARAKGLENCVLEGYFSREHSTLVFSDLILWRSNPMSCSEFEFRLAWLLSNLALPALAAATGLHLHVAAYAPCTLPALRQAYAAPLPYEREGLLFVHKDSFYLHGLNPNVLVWKDLACSKYLPAEIEESRQGCKGIGFLNKQGELKTIDNVILLRLDRRAIDPTHRFLRFTYSDIAIDNLEAEGEGKGESVSVRLEEAQVVESVRNFSGPTDSLSRLLYKCKLRHALLPIEQIAQKCPQ